MWTLKTRWEAGAQDTHLPSAADPSGPSRASGAPLTLVPGGDTNSQLVTQVCFQPKASAQQCFVPEWLKWKCVLFCPSGRFLRDFRGKGCLWSVGG